MTTKMSNNEIISVQMIWMKTFIVLVSLFIMVIGYYLLNGIKLEQASANILEMVTCTDIYLLKNNGVMHRQYK